MKRYVVTGGAGFIGSHLCQTLLQEGHSVVCVDNFVTGDPSNVDHLFDESRFDLVVRDVSASLQVPGRVDGIFHLASPASPVDYLELPIETLRTGSLGTFAVLDLARDKACPVLLASTSEVYGDPEIHPQSEAYWGHVNPIGPRSVYDEAKRFMEAAAMAYWRIHGLQIRLPRIFNTYGPRMRLDDGRVVPNFMCQALVGEPLTVYGDGAQTRSFCFVDDLVDGLLALFRSDECYPVNLGNPVEHSILDFARLIIDASGSSSTLEFSSLPVDDPKQRRPVIDRARRLLGWEPRVALSDGLKRTLAYFTRTLDAGGRTTKRRSSRIVGVRALEARGKTASA